MCQIIRKTIKRMDSKLRKYHRKMNESKEKTKVFEEMILMLIFKCIQGNNVIIS